MKKKFSVAVAIGMILSTSAPVHASIEQVNEFLSAYSSNEDTFRAEEFINESNGDKTLFVRVAIGSEDALSISNEKNIFLEMTRQNWFDYNYIYSASFGSDSSYFLNFNEYNVQDGTMNIQGNKIKYPWIIKTQDDLDSDTKRFLGRVTQELLQENISGVIDLKIGSGGEDVLSISESGGAVIVSGECQDGNTVYKYVVEFTYQMSDEWNGNYNTIYIGINDIDLYGKYKDLYNISLQ